MNNNRKNQVISYKGLDLDKKKIDIKARTIEGYGAVWHNVDSYGDVLLPTCCDKSIAERGYDSKTSRKMVLLNQHNQTEPIGHFVDMKSDEYGLYFKAYIDKTQKGDEVLEQISSGTLNQYSIGFNYVWDKCDWVTDYEYDGKMYSEVFVVKEIILWEVSVVTFGANELTHTIKGMTGEAIIAKLDNIDERFNDALSGKEKDLVQIRHLAHEYGQLVKALIENKPRQKALEENEPQKVTTDQILENIEKCFNNLKN